MAKAPAQQPEPQQGLPLLYNSLSPLSSQAHAKHGLTLREAFPETKGAHAIPLTVDEFVEAQRFYPIVFGIGDSPAPLALLGMNEGVNTAVDADGKWREGAYVPAYIRRYPFMLAKLTPEATELSLCFDDASGLVEDGKGEPLFDGDKPSERTQAILKFCENFEESVQRTRLFMDELAKNDLLMDGELTIEHADNSGPAIYRGFKIVNEDKLRELRGDVARKFVQNGMLGMIYAQLFSMANVREVYGRQAALGK
jgi:SapC